MSASGRFSVKKSGSPSKHLDKTNLIGDSNDDEVVVVSVDSSQYGSVNGGKKRKKKSRTGNVKLVWVFLETKLLLSNAGY